MTSQLDMFEPTGAKLVELVSVHLRNAATFQRIADTARIQGFVASTLRNLHNSEAAFRDAATCELALQFEQLAGLS